jgi:O-antigen/teichoic acid export membrane protein
VARLRRSSAGAHLSAPKSPGTGNRRAASTVVAIAGGANTLIAAGQQLVLIPVFVRRIGERLYGSWIGAGDLLSWMLVSDLGLANLLIQRVGAAHGRRDDESVGAWFAAGMLTMGVIAVLIAAAGVAGSFYLPRLYALNAGESGALQRTFAIASVSTAMTVFHTGLYGYCRAVQRPSLPSAMTAISAIAMFVGSWIGLHAGLQLGAIAAGFAARGGVLAISSLLIAMREVFGPLRGNLHLRRSVFDELWRTTPATAVAGFAYAAMNQSELFIASTVLSPTIAATFMLNRKAVELARSIADSVTFGSYGAFAHLVASPDRSRARAVYFEIFSIRSAVSIVFSAAFIAFNASFLTLWIGPATYSGITLTVLLAIQALISGNAFLANYLYRAAGFVVGGSVLLLIESILRVGLIFWLCRAIGVVGIPLAGIVSGFAFLVYTHRRLVESIDVGGAVVGPRRIPWRFWLAAALAFAAAAVIAERVVLTNWVALFASGAFAGALVSSMVLVTNPFLTRHRITLVQLLRRIARGASR